jgi:hypothetical protein
MIGQFEELLTECHDFPKVGRPKFDHDGVGITVNNLGIMTMAVINTVFRFHFLSLV